MTQGSVGSIHLMGGVVAAAENRVARARDLNTSQFYLRWSPLGVG